MAYAEVPTVPGLVADVAAILTNPKDHAENGGDFYPCGAMVKAGWWFDGSTFSPAAES